MKTQRQLNSVLFLTMAAFGLAGFGGEVQGCDSAEPVRAQEIVAISGTITQGNLLSLDWSDDDRLHLRLAPPGGGTPTQGEMTVVFSSFSTAPQVLGIEIESSTNRPLVVTSVSLFNWSTGQFDEWDSHAENTIDEVHTVSDIPAEDYVRADDGRIEMRLEITPVITSLAYHPQLEARFDKIGILVKQDFECGTEWVSDRELELTAEEVGYEWYDYGEYEEHTGCRYYPGQTSDPIVRVQVATPPDDFIVEGEAPFTWSADPNSSDYGAWRDPNTGSACFVWNRPGIYVVRLTRAESGQYTEVILADAYFAGVGPLAHGRRWLSTPNKYDQFPTDVDLIIVGQPGDKGNDRLAAEAIDAVGKVKVKRVRTVEHAGLIIRAASIRLEREVKVVLVGHGYSAGSGGGFFTFGTNRHSGMDQELSFDDGEPTVATLSFANFIDPFTSEIGFVSCATGEGVNGQNFIDLFATRCDALSWAYTTDITTYWGLRGFHNRFWLTDDGEQRFGQVWHCDLVMVPSPPAGGTVSPGNGRYWWYDWVVISAKPNPGYRFSRWRSSHPRLRVTDPGSPISVLVIGASGTVTALFEKDE